MVTVAFTGEISAPAEHSKGASELLQCIVWKALEGSWYDLIVAPSK